MYKNDDGGTGVETRKIQKVGAATLTISLPRAWVTQRRLKKGDPLFLVEEGEALKILPSEQSEHRQRVAPEVLVDADLCDEPGMLERVVVGNYVLGRTKITIRSAHRIRGEHQDEIRRATRRLMGLGTLDESASHVVLHCSIDPSQYPLETLIKRLYNLGATMLSESIEALATGDVALAEDALKREDDADMMYWLILRLVLSAQLDDALVDQLGMRSRIEIPGYRAIARDLEMVADHSRKIAKSVKLILESNAKVPSAVIKSVQALAKTIAEIYALALGGLLSRDLKQANKAIQLAESLQDKEEEFVRLTLKETRSPRGNDPALVVRIREIFANFTTIAEFGHAIAVIAYNRYLEKASNLCHPATGGR